ncbi:hypothetical protein [Mesorhizobium sp.]|uniref:hypothetical protein n=1 Tax=Mesorhizobium sp. TaxID=1871066 RepID=UPI0025D2FC76|nr:hypothetical protein [Mesorhizobium sp.]
MRGFPARPSRKTSNPASDEEDTVALDAAPNYLTRQAWREEKSGGLSAGSADAEFFT